jgi:hypothetical protein
VQIVRAIGHEFLALWLAGSVTNFVSCPETNIASRKNRSGQINNSNHHNGIAVSGIFVSDQIMFGYTVGWFARKSLLQAARNDGRSRTP